MGKKTKDILDEFDEDKKKKSESEKKKKILGISAVIGILAVGGIGGYVYHTNHVALKDTTIAVEYGKSIPTNANYYLKGSDAALKGAKVDVSKVDETEVGIYEAKATAGKKQFHFTVK